MEYREVAGRDLSSEWCPLQPRHGAGSTSSTTPSRGGVGVLYNPVIRRGVHELEEYGRVCSQFFVFGKLSLYGSSTAGNDRYMEGEDRRRRWTSRKQTPVSSRTKVQPDMLPRYMAFVGVPQRARIAGMQHPSGTCHRSLRG